MAILHKSYELSHVEGAEVDKVPIAHTRQVFSVINLRQLMAKLGIRGGPVDCDGENLNFICLNYCQLEHEKSSLFETYLISHRFFFPLSYRSVQHTFMSFIWSGNESNENILIVANSVEQEEDKGC